METEQIAKLLRSEKFHPFDVRTASGQSHRVRSREMAWLPPDAEVLLIYDPNQGVALIDTDQVVECVRPIIKGRDKGPRS